MDLLLEYFEDFSDEQMDQFRALQGLYAEWNEKINVISRKDIDNLYERHVLHSLSIAAFIEIEPDARIMDLGCGGGFPGIPLAIFHPEVEFVLVDSIGKKIRVVEEVSRAIGLENVRAVHGRAEETPGRFDFVVSRAVARLSKLSGWLKGKISREDKHDLPNGLIALKGGDLQNELQEFGAGHDKIPLKSFFDRDCFTDKYLVYVPAIKSWRVNPNRHKSRT